jgi:hypothetical protein
MIFVAAAILLLTGCKSMRETIEVPVYVHDTVYQKMVQYDSIYIDHFREVTKKNDTIYITDEVTKTKIVTKTDTAYRYIERPVTISKTETVEVKKPLPWWQKTLMYAGGVLLLALLGALIVWGVKHHSRLLP